jgi:uncharacterized BrkB/YihY/UPF0761 family membrane protein
MRLQAALYLSALLAVVNWSVFIYVQWYLPRLGDGSAIYAAGATLVLVGLWLQSRMARYVGAAFFFGGSRRLCAVGCQTGERWRRVGRYDGGAESGPASILVFSRSFARAFAAAREKRPPYKKYLLHAFTFMIVLAVAAGALIDIVSFIQLASGK